MSTLTGLWVNKVHNLQKQCRDKQTNMFTNPYDDVLLLVLQMSGDLVKLIFLQYI